MKIRYLFLTLISTAASLQAMENIENQASVLHTREGRFKGARMPEGMEKLKNISMPLLIIPTQEKAVLHRSQSSLIDSRSGMTPEIAADLNDFVDGYGDRKCRELFAKLVQELENNLIILNRLRDELTKRSKKIDKDSQMQTIEEKIKTAKSNLDQLKTYMSCPEKASFSVYFGILVSRLLK